MTAVSTRLDRLGRVDACAVSDAMDRLDLPSGVVDGLRPLTGHHRVAGRVVTVELGPPTGASGVHLCARAVEASGPGDVLVVAHQGRLDCAGWGGNLSRAAQRRGIGATLVHGAVRDVDEARELGYPVFALGATPRTARGRTEEVTWGTTVDLGGIAASTGDYVVADATGVVLVPEASVDAVLDAAEAIVAKEAAMAADIDGGSPITEVMGSSYERMLEER